MRKKQNGFSQLWFLVILGVLTLILIIGIIFMSRKSIVSQSETNSQVTSSQNGMPKIKITDMAPSLSNSQKTAVVVEHSDSTLEKFLIASDTVQAFTAALQKGERVVSQTQLK